MFTTEYFIPIENFQINSDTDYACLFLAIIMFDPYYYNICKYYDCNGGLNRNGVMISYFKKNPKNWNNAKFLEVFKYPFTDKKYQEDFEEFTQMPEDTELKILENLFAKKYLPPKYLFPQINLQKSIQKATPEKVKEYYKIIQSSPKIQLNFAKNEQNKPLEAIPICKVNQKNFRKTLEVFQVNRFFSIKKLSGIIKYINKLFSTNIAIRCIIVEQKSYLLLYTPTNNPNKNLTKTTISKLAKLTKSTGRQSEKYNFGELSNIHSLFS